MRMGLTFDAICQLTELRRNMADGKSIFPPLEMSSAADLVSGLKAEVYRSLYGQLSDDDALSALEASRYLPNARGQPTVSGAVDLVEHRSLPPQLAPSGALPFVPQFQPSQPPTAGGGVSSFLQKNGLFPPSLSAFPTVPRPTSASALSVRLG